jgi:hypothetical protein
MRNRKIKMRVDSGESGERAEIGGWYGDRGRTYLWLGLNGRCIGTISNSKLLRFAKTILKYNKIAASKAA